MNFKNLHNLYNNTNKMNSYMLERNAMSIGVIYMLSSTLRYLTVHTKCHKTDYYIYYILVTFKVFLTSFRQPRPTFKLCKSSQTVLSGCIHTRFKYSSNCT